MLLEKYCRNRNQNGSNVEAVIDLLVTEKLFQRGAQTPGEELPHMTGKECRQDCPFPDSHNSEIKENFSPNGIDKGNSS